MKIQIKFVEALFFISFGGFAYYYLEIMFRGHSHYSMFLCGGIIFYCISLFHRKYNMKLFFITRMIIAAFIITFFELIFGIIFNIVLQEQVWDYSDHYFHWKGQICLTFSILWFFLTCPVLIIEQKIRKFLTQS